MKALFFICTVCIWVDFDLTFAWTKDLSRLWLIAAPFTQLFSPVVRKDEHMRSLGSPKEDAKCRDHVCMHIPDLMHPALRG